MRQAYLDDEESPIELSFLDVVCCGLVAAMFMALLFSVVGQLPPSELKTLSFLELVIDVADTEAALGVAVRPPESPEWFSIPVEDFDSSGRIKVDAAKWPSHISGSGEFLLLGFKPYFRSDKMQVAKDGQARFVVHIDDPSRGQWEFAIFRRDSVLTERGAEAAVADLRVMKTTMCVSSASKAEGQTYSKDGMELGADHRLILKKDVVTNPVGRKN
jgi:hypothetical protein